MKERVIPLVFLATIVLTASFLGCGGSNSPITPFSPSTPTSPSAPTSPTAAVTIRLDSRPLHLGASETYLFTATVSNASDKIVHWSISACAAECGTISDAGFYTAPSFVAAITKATITATSQADSTKTASVTLPRMPISVSLIPNGPANVPPSGTKAYSVFVDHDPQHTGVTWAISGAGCSGAGCGTLTSVTATSATYRAPAAEPNPYYVTLIATSVGDPDRNASITLTVSDSPFQLEGKYAFLINGWHDGIMEAAAGHFDVDVNGNLTGVWDSNGWDMARGEVVDVDKPITGSYNIQPNGHGTLTLEAGAEIITYVLSLDPDGVMGRLAESSPPAAGDFRGSSGYLVKQDAADFNLSSLDGDRVIALYGTATGSHVAALGRFSSAAGTLNNAVMDLSWAINQNVGMFPNTVSLTGEFGPLDIITGRGTASLTVKNGASTTYHFAYYIVSDDRVLLLQTDARGFNAGLLIPTLSGEVRRQNTSIAFGNQSLNLPIVFHLTDSTDDWAGDGYAMIRVGQLIPTGSGSLLAAFDENTGGRVSFTAPSPNGYIILNGTGVGNYSVAQNGRVTWTLSSMSSPLRSEDAIGYLVGENEGYFMSPGGDGASFGAFEPQTLGPDGTTALAGKYRISTGPPAALDSENDLGWMTLAADGTGTATMYVNQGSGATPVSLTATLTLVDTGRGTITFNTDPPGVPKNIVFWEISPSRLVALSTVNPGDSKPVLLLIERTD